jgi:hypothetical protein
MNQIVQKGTSMQIDGYEWRTLSSVVPADSSQLHRANYISTIGAKDSTGVYGIEELSDVSENWQIDSNGHWNIDQWIFEISDEGELTQVSHNTLIETLDGQVLDDQALPVAAISDPVQLQQWGQVLDAWYALPQQ